MKRTLLVCSAGASSGFMAKAIRKAAKKVGIDMEVEARPESSLADYLDSIDYLLIAPHLSFLREKLILVVGNRDIKVIDIPEDIYGMLDGEGALKLMLD